MSSLVQARYLWLFAFCYAIVASLVFQKFLLPALPSLHGGSGLLMYDAIFYHKSAVLIAGDIHAQGWSAWSFWSAKTNTTGNVAILAALYAAFSIDPALIIPVNAFLHATSAFLLFLISRELWSARVGTTAGMVAAVLFVIFPSALSWYSQPLKDSFLIAGILLIVYSWLRALRPQSIKAGVLLPLIWMAAGVLLVTLVKPYYLMLLLVATGLTTCVVTINLWWTKPPQRFRILSFYIVALSMILVTHALIKPNLNSGSGLQYAEWTDGGSQEAADKGEGLRWQWAHSTWLPESLDKYLEITAKTRAGMIQYNQQVGANSLIDAEAAPKNATEVIQYLPRALQIGLFAPMPNTWMQKLSVARLVAIGETIIWYCLIPGLFAALYYRRTLAVAVVLVSALYFLAVLSFVTPNVGTLYRYRYAYEFLLIVVAVGGWIEFFLKHRNMKAQAVEPDNSLPVSEAFVNTSPGLTSKKRLISAGLMVSLVTLIVSFGFFARDLILTRWFGAGNEVDSFFLGAMIPMFVISALALPAGAALTPVYCDLRSSAHPSDRARLAGAAALFLSLLLAAISVFFYFLTPYLLGALNLHFLPEQLADIRAVINVYLVIMFLGGLVIVANAVLNAEGRTVFPTVAQLVVPAAAITGLFLFGASHGIYAVIYGMLIGQLINLLIVYFALRQQNLLPSFRTARSFPFTGLPLRQFFFLVAAALFTALLVPVANILATHLPSGSVAIIGLGTKVVLLITGVIGAGITTILLPYFAGLAAKRRHSQAQSDLSFFLLFVTLLSVPVGGALVMLAEPMARLMFENSVLTETDIASLVSVIQYGLIQLPFFTCGLVAIKYITAYQRSGVILFASLVNLGLTVLLGVFLAKIIGVAGIALAMTLAVGVSAAILIFYANHLKHLSVFDSIFIAFNWIVFITLAMSWHYQLQVGVVICSLAYLLLVAGNWHALISEWRAKEAPSLS